MSEAAAGRPLLAGMSFGDLLRVPMVLPVLAVLTAFLVGCLLVVAMGVAPGKAIAAFANGAFGSGYAISVSINRAVVFALVGLGFVLANRANLTNVGGEGQIAVGGIVATAIALYGGVAGLGWLAFIIPTLGAVLAGAVWGGIAGVLKARVGTNEVISTLLLSFIAIWLVYWCVQSEALLRQPMTTSATLPESAEIPFDTQIPLLTGDYAAPVTIGAVVEHGEPTLVTLTSWSAGCAPEAPPSPPGPPACARGGVFPRCPCSCSCPAAASGQCRTSAG